MRDADIDAWYTQQVTARFMPLWETAFLCASGPRVAVSGLHRDSFAYSAPYEDVQLKSS